MIPGFNHNIKHKGLVYHVQTEDSGPKNPHIITHLFVGGNVVASKKCEYADIVGKPEHEKTVRTMMEDQHKEMLRNLVNGAYDRVAQSPSYALDGPPPVNFMATSPATSAMTGAAAFIGLPGRAPSVATRAGLSLPPVPAARSPDAPALAPARGISFGEDLVSERSLDEVILGYLAEDLVED